MQVKNRIFPYPVLNNNAFISNYKDIIFELHYDEYNDNEYYILKNIRFSTNSDFLLKLYKEKKIKVVCILECSYTVYRKAIYIGNEIGQDIKIAKNDVSDKIFISMYAFTTEDIVYASKEFDEDYADINFEIEKYDIIAANDGYYYSIIHEENEDNLSQSIFSIIIDRDLKDGTYLSEYDSTKKIVISLSEEDYNNYKLIHSVPIYNEVFFNMLLVPTLTEALTKCSEILINDSSIDEIEDLTNNYLWFRSIMKGYNKLTGEILTKEKFLEKTPIYWAQILLGKPLSISLNRLVDEMKKINAEDNDNE